MFRKVSEGSPATNGPDIQWKRNLSLLTHELRYKLRGRSGLRIAQSGPEHAKQRFLLFHDLLKVPEFYQQPKCFYVAGFWQPSKLYVGRARAHARAHLMCLKGSPLLAPFLYERAAIESGDVRRAQDKTNKSRA